MWPGHLNNGPQFPSLYANQHDEQNTNFNPYFIGDNVNYLRQFHTGDNLSYLPNASGPEVGEHQASFAPQSMQSIGFQQLYPTGVGGLEGIYNTSAAQPRYETLHSCHVNDESIGLAYQNIAMVDRFGQRNICSQENVRAIKRKAEEDYSPWYTGAKRRIIDEGMAAGINNLYIGSDHNYCSSNEIMYHPDEELNMVFGAAADDVQTNDYNNDDDEGKRKEHPVFHFSAPLEEILKRTDDILPQKVIEEICKPCLAVIPWTPPLNDKVQTTEEQQISHEGSKKRNVCDDEML